MALFPIRSDYTDPATSTVSWSVNYPIALRDGRIVVFTYQADAAGVS